MIIDGIELLEGSHLTNAVIASGAAFPSGVDTPPNIGELFYLTAADSTAGLYFYTGTVWDKVSFDTHVGEMITSALGSVVGVGYYATLPTSADVVPPINDQIAYKTGANAGFYVYNLAGNTWGFLTGPATTLAGYGITNAYTKTEVDSAIAGVTISSLPWASITSTPTTLNGYGITNGQVHSADLDAITAASADNVQLGFLQKEYVSLPLANKKLSVNFDDGLAHQDYWNSGSMLSGSGIVTGEQSVSGTKSLKILKGSGYGVAYNTFGTLSTFTIEAWINPFDGPVALSAGDGYLIKSGTIGGFILTMSSTGALMFNNTTLSSSFVLNQWNHVAITFTAGTLKIYINGISAYSSNAWAGITLNDLQINDAGYTRGAGFYIDNLLVTNTVRYSASFTPSTEIDYYNWKLTTPTTLASYGITDALPLSGGTLTGNLSITSGSHITINSAPASDTDAANKLYVDSLAAGLSWKNSAKAATTANITLSGTQTVDGVVLVAGNRVLVKDQTTASQNGIYVVAAGAWTRATDMDSTTPINEVNSAAVFVEQGTTYADTGWTQVNAVTTLGTDAIAFTQFNGAAGVTPGVGLSKTGNQLDINLGAGIAQLPTDEIGVDIYSGGGLFTTVDGTTTSTLTGAQLSLTKVGTAGTYKSVTTDAYGRITAGTNPTTLAGYGITDAQPLDADLTSIANLAHSSNGFIVSNGSNWTISTPSNSRTSLGATTVGDNLITLTNPSAITFLQVNADNSVSTLDAASFRTAIGAGTGGSVSYGAGIIELPTSEIGIDVYATGGLMTTVDGSTSDTTTSSQLSLIPTGVTAGWYLGVNVDAHGRVIAGDGQSFFGEGINLYTRSEVDNLIATCVPLSTNPYSDVSSELNSFSNAISNFSAFSLDAAVYRSAKMILQVKNITNTAFQVTEILLIHDGTTVSFSEINTINIGTPFVTFDVQINAFNLIELLVTSTSGFQITAAITAIKI